MSAILQRESVRGKVCQPHGKHMSSQAKPRLLVVDDEPDMLEFVERVARRRFQVTSCQTADEALAELAVGDYEVLITDQKMPRVSGLELLGRRSSLHRSSGTRRSRTNRSRRRIARIFESATG